MNWTGLDWTGLVKRGLVKRGLVKRGLVKRGLVKRGLVKRGLVKRELVKRGLVKRRLVKRGLVKRGLQSAKYSMPMFCPLTPYVLCYILLSCHLLVYSPLWKRVIAWERSRAASGYGIIWGDADRNKQEGI